MRRESRAFSRVGRSIWGKLSALMVYVRTSMGACEQNDMIGTNSKILI